MIQGTHLQGWERYPVAVGLRETAPSFAILLCGSLSFALPVAAQETGSTGNLLTFSVGERLQYNDNRDLSVTSLGATTEAITALTFGLSKNTGSSLLQVDANLELLFAAAPSGSTVANGLNNPFLGIAYQTASASSAFNFDASLRQTTLSQIRAVTDFDTGSGVRGNYSVGASMDWGRDARLGYGLSAAYEDISYIDTTDPGLIDARRFDLGLNARLALSPTTQLTLGLDRSDFREDGARSSDVQIGGTAGLVIRRANGDVVSANIFIDNTETGQREGLSAQYKLALPNGSLMFTPGLTRATTGKVYWTSDFQWQQDLPNGSFSATWGQEVTSQNETDDEVVLSDVSLSYAHAVNRLNSVQISLDWAQQVFTSSGDTSSNAGIGAVWSRSLTEDWDLDLGYRHRVSDESTSDRAKSNMIYLQLNRNFATRY